MLELIFLTRIIILQTVIIGILFCYIYQGQLNITHNTHHRTELVDNAGDIEISRQLYINSHRNKAVYEGVAVSTFLGSPKWFQNRYSMMISNIDHVIPMNWAIQIFYKTNKMGVEGSLICVSRSS